MTKQQRQDNMTEDFTITNPSLHKRYVISAQNNLLMWAGFLQILEETSQVTNSILAGIIHDYRANEIKQRASYREAAWRILANDLLLDEDQDWRTKEQNMTSSNSLVENAS
jgi:hypothetical protein